MADFDRSLDKQLFAEEMVFERTKIIISVMSYNEGQPKIQFSRSRLDNNDDSGEWKWAKLGRMTKEEGEKTIMALQKAVEFLSK